MGRTFLARCQLNDFIVQKIQIMWLLPEVTWSVSCALWKNHWVGIVPKKFYPSKKFHAKTVFFRFQYPRFGTTYWSRQQLGDNESASQMCSHIKALRFRMGRNRMVQIRMWKMKHLRSKLCKYSDKSAVKGSILGAYQKVLLICVMIIPASFRV